MSRYASFFGSAIILCCLGVCRTAAAIDAGASKIVRSSDVVRITIERHPSIQMSLLSVERAAETVSATTGNFPLVFNADTGYSHSSSPMGRSLYQRIDEVSLGVGISKTFSFGASADFQLDGQWYRMDTPTLGTLETADVPNYGLGARLTLSQPLLRGFGNRVGLAPLRQAQKDKTVAEKSAERTASALAKTVLDTYWSLWLAAKTVEINLKSREVAAAQLQETVDKVALGADAPVDKISFQTRLASLDELLISSEADVRQLETDLAAAVGVIDTHPLLLADTTEVLPITEEVPSLREILKQSLESSPAVPEAFANLASAEEKLRVAGESLRQRLDLTAWVEARTLAEDELSPVVTDFSKEGAYSGYVGLQYELPLDNRKKKGERAQARLAVEIAAQNLRSVENQVRADTASALDALLTARKQLEKAEETLHFAEAQAEAERERYRLGASTFTTVRDAEETLRSAQLRVTGVRVSIVKAQNNLDYITGRLLQSLPVR